MTPRDAARAETAWNRVPFSRPYQISQSEVAEGLGIVETLCAACARDDFYRSNDPKRGCRILAAATCGEPTPETSVDPEGVVHCSEFRDYREAAEKAHATIRRRRREATLELPL